MRGGIRVPGNGTGFPMCAMCGIGCRRMPERKSNPVLPLP